MKKTNPKLIGVFVLGGLMLVVSALILFSSQDLFTPKRTFVAYFHQSVNGLNVGAPVRFRGIPVGVVLAIDGVYDPKTGNMIPRLLLEFRPETLANASVEEGEYTLFPLLLKAGLRASLKTASLLTGQLYVSMDFHPEIPARVLGTGDDEYPEMPTIDSGFDEAIAKLTDLPIEEVLTRAGGAFAALTTVLEDPNIGKSLQSLVTLLNDTDTTVIDLRRFIHSNVGATLAEANKTLASTRDSLSSLSDHVTEKSLPQIDLTMGELEALFKLGRQRLGRDDPLNYEILAALREVGGAARSMRALADFLEEHPEALLKGKNGQ
jgi:paraquat-inducible protein B